MTINSAETLHPEYMAGLPKWQLVEDVVDGQMRVKHRGERYLPAPNPEDRSEANQERYEQYLKRALLYNVCFKTLSAMVGIAFRVPPKVDLPVEIEYLGKNADGGRLTLDQQAQYTLSEVIKKGRCGLLVDYPSTEGDTSRADVARGIRARIKTYTAESILDWNETATNEGLILDYVKLIEISSVLNPANGTRELQTEYVILRLNDGGYSFERLSDGGEQLAYHEPRKADGKRFDYIPFVFAGSENNNPDVDQALIYDLAEVNISHYRNSADNEEASFITGQPTLGVTSSLSAHEWQDQNPNGVQIGSRKGHFLGESGSLSLVQAQATNLPREIMKDKEAYMVALGAQIVSPQSTETAFTTGVNLATNTSALALAVRNVSEAYGLCMRFALDYMTTANRVAIYSINTDFFPANVDAQTITAWVAGVQGGILPASALYSMLRDANVTQKTDEEIIEENESSSNGLNLGE